MASPEEEEFEFRLRAEQEAAAPKSPVQAPIPKKTGIDWGISGQDVRNTLGDVGRLGGLAVRGITQGVTGIPGMVEDAAISGYNRLTGSKVPTYAQTLNERFEQVPGMGAPRNAGEQLVESAASTAGGMSVPVPGAAAAPAGKALSPRMQQIQQLAGKGVVTTPGQNLGGAVSSLEQKLASMPVIGDIIKNARGKSVEQFARATINDALQHVSASLPEDVKGAEAIQSSARILDQKFNQILPKLKGDLNSPPPASLQAPGAAAQAAPQSLSAELAQIRQNARQGLSAGAADTVDRVLENEVTKRFTAAGKANGHTLQDIRETLRTEFENYQKGDPDQRKIAGALREARAAVDRMIAAQNPGPAGQEFTQLQMAYAKHKIAALASRYARARGGNPTANQFLNAAYAKDASKGKTAWEKGRALQQRLGTAGSEILSSTEPNSGTADRGLLAGMALHPGAAIPGLAAAIPGSILYSQRALRAMQSQLLGPGVSPQTRAQVLKALATLGVQNPQEAQDPQLQQDLAQFGVQ